MASIIFLICFPSKLRSITPLKTLNTQAKAKKKKAIDINKKGSVLGPLLFLLCINDLFLSSNYLSFKNLFMLSVRISSYCARGKFGEHERCIRVARGDSRVQL